MSNAARFALTLGFVFVIVGCGGGSARRSVSARQLTVTEVERIFAGVGLALTSVSKVDVPVLNADLRARMESHLPGTQLQPRAHLAAGAWVWVVVGKKYSDADFSGGYGPDMVLGTGKIVTHGGSLREYHNVVVGWDSRHSSTSPTSLDTRISTVLDRMTGSTHRGVASALTVVTAPTPPLPVPHYRTSGTYPQVRGANLDLRAVNAALRKAVLVDEREYAPYARKQKAQPYDKQTGVYRTTVDRSLLSASTVVVSALLPMTKEDFPGQHGGDGWLLMTVRVPSGEPVAITQLFANPPQGLRALATAWKAIIRRTSAAPCLHAYHALYSAIAQYQDFALTPRGIAVGFSEQEACYRLLAIVPYRAMRPYLSKLGATLIAGVRPAR